VEVEGRRVGDETVTQSQKKVVADAGEGGWGTAAAPGGDLTPTVVVVAVFKVRVGWRGFIDDGGRGGQGG
jgi:hypothetical protein